VSVRDVLLGARAILTPPGSWIQGRGALDAEGREVISTEVRAVCWCLLGAVMRAAYDTSNKADAARLLNAAWNTINDTLPGGRLVAFNDTPGRQHWEILELLDTVIATLES